MTDLLHITCILNKKEFPGIKNINFVKSAPRVVTDHNQFNLKYK